MGSVVHFDFPFRQSTAELRQAALLERFVSQRRPEQDVFWLKENAELLNIFQSCGFELPLASLAPFDNFYASIEKRLSFFPQYYRFLLSMCLDLEDLGMSGNCAEAAVEWVSKQGFVGAELSDLQRAEARRLCLRRGVDPVLRDPGLDDRLRDFTTRSETFAIPNKKAAYELTHIVFYLSDYGLKDPCLDEKSIQSLRFAGTLAYLELNIDLLAEICIALRFAEVTPPQSWDGWLAEQTRYFAIREDDIGWRSDAYHPYFMLNWHLALSGQGGFGAQIPEGPISFTAPRHEVAPLRELSEQMYTLDEPRHPDWSVMRRLLDGSLSDMAREVIDTAEQEVDFQSFFQGFARSSAPGAMG